MNIESLLDEEKPQDWPVNALECRLENISNQINLFKQNPSYTNKEVLVSLVTDYDLNQRSNLGLIRTTKYEIDLINILFLEGCLLQFHSLKSYLYEIIGYKADMQRKISLFTELNESFYKDEFKNFLPSLCLYYLSYQVFSLQNDKNYAKQLIEVVNGQIRYLKDNNSTEKYREGCADITCAFILLLNDLSYFRCKKRTNYMAFSDKDLFELFKLMAELIRINGDSPVKRPLKGVLMTCVSNYILKSRYNYNEDYICKYISSSVAHLSTMNYEIWMSEIENLNDEREKRVIPELFIKGNFSDFPWVENLNFASKRDYYVSSFCKSIRNSKMEQDYGPCIYGFKDDRLAELIAPISFKYSDEGNRCPAFSHVVAFDVIYDIEEAKEEINYLCSIIDLFDMRNADKKKFFEDIMQYWILSVKDKKWSHERERRYVIFMYKDYDYYEIDTSDCKYLKIRTSIFLQPDFILGHNPVKPIIKYMVDDKRMSLYSKAYLFCEDCLSRDFDSIFGVSPVNLVCSICKSKNVSIIYPTTIQ